MGNAGFLREAMMTEFQGLQSAETFTVKHAIPAGRNIVIAKVDAQLYGRGGAAKTMAVLRRRWDTDVDNPKSGDRQDV